MTSCLRSRSWSALSRCSWPVVGHGANWLRRMRRVLVMCLRVLPLMSLLVMSSTTTVSALGMSPELGSRPLGRFVAASPCDGPDLTRSEWAACATLRASQQSGSFLVLAMWLSVLLLVALLVLVALRGSRN